MESKEIISLRQQNARLKKAVKDSLGQGIWGLDKKVENITHEEIVFLFARIFPALGIDYIKEIRTSYPDCVCVMDGNDIDIEFEPLLSSFRDHINKDDLTKCQYIVCWENDLEPHNYIQEEIDKNDIKVIQLREIYEEGKIKSRAKSIKWSKRDFDKLNINKLRALYAFIALDKEILTKEEIGEYLHTRGRPLGGILGTFTKNKDWLVRKHPSGGWQFNQEYKPKVMETIKKFRLDMNT